MGGTGRLRGKTTSNNIIRKEDIVGLKLTIRHCLLGSCALLLLAPACATSSKTAKPARGLAKKKGSAAKATTAELPSNDKSTSKSQPSDAAKTSKGATAVEAKKPAPPPEPALPSRFPQPLHCPTPSEVQAGTALTIRCAVKPALATRTVVVHYRPSGTDRFITTDATRSPKGWYVVNIKASEVKGTSLQFFAEAYNANNKMTASNGTDESPNILLIRKGATGTAGTGGTDQAVADEDPLAHIQREREAESGQSDEGRRRRARNLWLAVGLGSGYGWFPKSTPEAYTGASVKGWASGGVLHLLPEIGYQWTDRIAFSLQGRYQFVYTQTGAGNVVSAQPKTWAFAVLGRVYLFTDSLFGSASNLRLFGTGSLGGGTAFRLYVAPSPSSTNSNANFVNSDTVRGGPFAAGLGGGLAYHLTNYLTLAAELRALAGFWDVATVFEAGLSAQVGVWSPGTRRAAAAQPETELAPEPEYTPPE